MAPKDRMTFSDRIEEQYDALETQIIAGKGFTRMLGAYNTIVWMVKQTSTKQAKHG